MRMLRGVRVGYSHGRGMEKARRRMALSPVGHRNAQVASQSISNRQLGGHRVIGQIRIALCIFLKLLVFQPRFVLFLNPSFVVFNLVVILLILCRDDGVGFLLLWLWGCIFAYQTCLTATTAKWQFPRALHITVSNRLKCHKEFVVAYLDSALLTLGTGSS